MGSSNLGFFFMGLKVPKVTLGVLGLFLSLGTIAYADVAPVPAPGTASLLVAPNPNPVNYNFTAGTIISSAQVNTNGYKIYSDIGALVSKMNATTSLATSYTCPYCITQVLNGAGVVSTISGPTANGQSLSIVLGVVPIGNGGTGTSSPSGLIAGSGVTVTGSFPNQTVTATGSNSTLNPDGTNYPSPTHRVFGIVLANLATQTIGFTGAAVFTSATSYHCIVNDLSAQFLLTAQTNQQAGQYAWPTTAGRYYLYDCFGY